MKERQRWRPEEDALLRAYVKKYGPREWNLVSQRMNKVLDRDAKSSQERWKNYLKPGIKKGSLTEEEQRLVVSLQAKYGNKWKKIAAEVPGRTAKRLGKWWEVFKEKQEKQKSYTTTTTTSESANPVGEGKYDHILQTFAEKHMQNQKQHFVVPINYSLPSVSVAMPPPPLSLNLPPNAIPIPDFFHMTPSASTPSTSSTVGATSSRPPWMSSLQQSASKSSVKSSYTSSESASPSSSSPSVTLSLSPSLSNQVVSNASPNNGVSEIPEAIPKENFKPNSSCDNMQISAAETNLLMHQISSFFQQCQELEERQQSWLMHKREASWRLKRLQEQLESEKARKRREKIEEIESKVWALREEEKLYLDRLEKDYREQIARLHRDEEIKEARMMEMWTSKHVQLTRFYEHMVHGKGLKP